MLPQNCGSETAAPPSRGVDTGMELWQQILEAMPHGIALLDADTNMTLWANNAFQSLLESGVGIRDVIARVPTDYLPHLGHAEWEDTARSVGVTGQEANALSPARLLPRRRLQFVDHATRNIAYWEWTLQHIVAAGHPYLLLTLFSVSESVMNERLLATVGRTAERARYRAEALVRLTQLVNASLTPFELLRAITQEASAYFDTASAAVLLLTPDQNHFTVGYGIGLDPEVAVQILPLHRDQMLAGRAISERRTLVMTDPVGRGIDTPLLADNSVPVTLITSPIIHRDHIYGVVEVYFAHAREVSDESLALLSAFADQTAIALLKADLYLQIEEQHRQLQSIFDHAPVAIVYFDMEGVVVTANAAAAARFNSVLSEIIGHHYSDFLRDTPLGNRNLFARVSAGVPFHASHFVHRRPDGTEGVCDLSLLPVRDTQHQVVGLLLLSYDVSELVAAQQEAEAARRSAVDALAEVRSTQSQMVQMEKMRAVGELASGIAHDFNNALMAILGYTELAEDDIADPEALTAHLSIIKKAALDASATVQRLQRFARQRVATHGVTTDLNEVVRDVVEMTRPRWRDAAQKEGRTYDVQVHTEPLPVILGEPSGLREVLVNMIYNAFNAMPSGGQLTLTTRRYGEDQVEIQVADTGVGMSKQVMERIFDPFFTTRGVEGTGLGLAVSWTIIQRHGGTIAVESEPGKGTQFRIRLPIGHVEPATVSVPLPPPAAESEAENVLIVDDEPIVSSVLTSILSRHGFRVSVAHNAHNALEQLRQQGTDFRLMLTDHGMPGMNGLELVAETKRLYPDLPVLLLTGWGETVLQTHVAGALPDAVLGKPINQSDLLEAVHRVMRNRQ